MITNFLLKEELMSSRSQRKFQMKNAHITAILSAYGYHK